MVSTSIAILDDRGRIDVSRPIDFYLKPLAGTVWEGTPVIDILDMASGIDCPEVLSEADSCFWEFYGDFGWPERDPAMADPMNTAAQMSRSRPSGQAFDYTSVNTELLTWLVEAVSKERFSDFVEREIWKRTRAEADAFITATTHGTSFSAGVSAAPCATWLVSECCSLRKVALTGNPWCPMPIFTTSEKSADPSWSPPSTGVKQVHY
jgi:CubicO group peptidase (beta-lactamase class C family)